MADISDLIYRILKAIAHFDSCEEPDMRRLSPEALHDTPSHVDSALAMLVREGLVDGVEAVVYSDNTRSVFLHRPSLTLKGVAFLESDPSMVAARKRARGER